MPPILRDVHPDRAPVELYGDDGKVLFRFDLDLRLLAWADKLAAKEKVSFQRFMADVLVRGIHKIEDQLGDHWKT